MKQSKIRFRFIRKMSALKVITLFFLALIYVTDGSLSDSSCGDWSEYKEEKCLKIFESPGLLNYADAEKFCQEKDDSHLLSIGVKEEQKFIEDYLKTNAVVDNVWIGLKYVNKTYSWTDGTPLQYTNWAKGSPNNNSDYCVQISSEISTFGTWSDTSCGKKNAVVCEKIQLWSLTQIQTTLMNLVKNPVPIGFTYVQLPNEKTPEKIWPWLGWKDVSLEYESVFFRVAGKNSSAFGEIQEENSPRITGMEINWWTTQYLNINITKDDTETLPLGIHGSSSGNSMKVRFSGGEVRPRNMAVRIWKRVQ